MQITRRLFFSLVSSVFFTAVSLGDSPTPKQRFLAFVGTYTDKTESKGIYVYEFDLATGKLAPRGLAAETPNPSWVVIHPNGRFLYAANESGQQSTISAFSLEPGSAKLTLLNQLPAQGEDPCHLSFDKTGKYLFVANYTSGNVVIFPILSDGRLGTPTANVKNQGTLGPSKERQQAPHAHWIAPSWDGRSVWVADLGLDRVLRYGFDATEGTLSTGPFHGERSHRPVDPSAILVPGTGPRHVAFSKIGSEMYVLGELHSTITAFHIYPDGQPPISFQKISALPKDFSARNDAAEIAIHPSGQWLFVSNRGQDSIAVFAIDPDQGTLAPAGHFPSGGKDPRHFALDPTGQFLLAENQNSNSIVTFRINPATGALTQVSKTNGIPSPVCLVFIPEP